MEGAAAAATAAAAWDGSPVVHLPEGFPSARAGHTWRHVAVSYREGSFVAMCTRLSYKTRPNRFLMQPMNRFTGSRNVR